MIDCTYPIFSGPFLPFILFFPSLLEYSLTWLQESGGAAHVLLLGWLLFCHTLRLVTAFVLLAVRSSIIVYLLCQEQWAVIPRLFLSMSPLKDNRGRSVLYIFNESVINFSLWWIGRQSHYRLGRSAVILSDGSIVILLSAWSVDILLSDWSVGRIL